MPINLTCTLEVKRSSRVREKLFAHHDLAVQVEPDQMKDCLTKINADGV